MLRAQATADWPKFNGYRPLRSWNREIRLLEFVPPHRRPTNQPGQLTLKIDHVELDDAPTFHALSYNWGPATAKRSIVVDGETVEVRESLWLFLYCLRRRVETKHLSTKFWLDALCINQSDDDEKGEQVRMMGEIYSAADQAFAWIGNGNPKTDSFFREVKRRLSTSQSWPSWRYLPRDLQRTVEAGLSDIMSRSYWSRLWIIQEVALSQSVWIACGDYFVRWQDLGAPMEYIGINTGFPEHDFITLKENKLLWERLQKRGVWASRDSSLGKLIYEFYQAKCSDPRDKIYGVLSMAKERDREDFPIDYKNKKKAFEVLIDFWNYCTEQYTHIKEIQERRIPVLVWLLWTEMELGSSVEYFPHRSNYSETITDVLGYEDFATNVDFIGHFKDFSHKLWNSNSEPFERRRKSKGSSYLGVLTYSAKTMKGAHVKRYWPVTTTSQLLPDDFCYVVKSQPSDINVAGNFETVQNQSLVVGRVVDGELTCVGRGKEIPSEFGETLTDSTMMSTFLNGLRSDAEYQFELDYDPVGKYNYLLRMEQKLLLNAAAVCEVMITPWGVFEYVSSTGRERVRFEGRHGEGFPWELLTEGF